MEYPIKASISFDDLSIYRRSTSALQQRRLAEEREPRDCGSMKLGNSLVAGWMAVREILQSVRRDLQARC